MRVFYEMQIAYSVLSRAVENRTREMAGLSPAQLAVLFCLRDDAGVAMGDIARALRMGKSGLSGLIDRMCAKGLVERSGSGDDGRVSKVLIKDRGRAALALGRRETKRINAALLAPFSDEDLQVIHRFLTHVQKNSEAIVSPPSDTKSES